MRVYLDTNLYVSYLLNPFSDAPPAAIIRNGISGKFTILFGDRTLQELLGKIVNKPYLTSRITMDDVSSFLDILTVGGERVHEAPDVIPAVSRDRNDDYLITYAVFGHADYLVTADNDLLVLGCVDNLQIVSPAEFILLLEQGEE